MALGDICYVTYHRKGEKVEPPRDPIDPSKGRYDSVVASPGIDNGRATQQDHREFVIFNGKRAYPDLVINIFFKTQE